MPIIRVAINVPVGTLFDYQAEDANVLDIGLRVCVPFGKKKITGIIMAISMETQIPIEKLKSAYGIFREINPLPPALLNLFHFCSQYYHHPLGMVILNSLPAMLRNNKPVKLKEWWAQHPLGLTDLGRQVDIANIPARNRVARRLLTEFQNATNLTVQQIKQISPRASKLLIEWKQLGWVAEKPIIQTTPSETAIIPTLTAEQESAVTTVTARLEQFNTWLLHGVTGSGKTEVYLRIIESALSRGKQTLVLIPEINLTPQLEAVFRARFCTIPLVNLHSGLNDTERLTGWLQAQRGEAKIILGTRLAVFTPLPELGLIIVDEEHDSSFKQQDGLRYSARDLAIFRARETNIPIVLGSATPSLESYFNAINGRYQYIRLASRAVKNARLPMIQYIDTRIHKSQDGLSVPLLKAIEKCLAEQRQTLIFINRRGYAPVLLCKSCAWSALCQRCSSRLVVHLRDKKLRCHHCGHEENFPRACPQCGNQDIAPFGQGTQRVEESLIAHFPSARILRIDRDSTRRKNAWQEILHTIHTHQVDILIGTQLLAKGHDFQNLSLVGILNADTSLYSTDFRASERLFSQLMQVSGRAGRANAAGHVLIQTEFPDHPLYYSLQQHDYDVLAQTLLTERKMAGFPPYVYQALLRAEAHDIKIVLNFLKQAAHLAKPTQAIQIFDPVPAQLVRLKGMERAYLLIQSSSRKQLQAFLTEWSVQISTLAIRKVRWVVDVDPIEF
ncbi:primosomal protein N' [Nitrosomonas supralitoralis]|uniref:Replication restart protein PriA n=1 Tax=Nitrosomonas supralitoralis TaxID=2116706 RepID=A0A2P7NVD2_9PROT|nr:primosomal protein N' [Nitrosomonas supralitoralis]PSJ17430.1 primosomal protein N' [Nitrosomonas supralitoralis]